MLTIGDGDCDENVVKLKKKEFGKTNIPTMLTIGDGDCDENVVAAASVSCWASARAPKSARLTKRSSCQPATIMVTRHYHIS
ncbi:hypothetical protein QE152_g10361 [Popillia japonica]|uniref:Uncharacterized protein n=1 Tax=Popillia japonica TaxID=7064 RepID=A0AAW1LRK6_POPJA